MNTKTTTTDQTFIDRFAAVEHEYRDIAYSLGRCDIFDRDLKGEGSYPTTDTSTLAGKREAIETAISGIWWYMDEEYEHLDSDSGEREAAFNADPRTAKLTSLRKFLGR